MLIAGDDTGSRSVVAAATAVGSTDDGRKTALVHIDGSVRHQDLADDVCVALTLDTLADRDSWWRELGPRLSAAVGDLNPVALEAAEVAVLPGVDDVGLLLSLHRLITTGSNDVVVVALCELSRAITLLAMPEGIDRLLDRAFPISVRVEQVLAGSGPSAEALDSHEAIESLRSQLRELTCLLHSSSTTIRLVCAPEQAAYERAVSAYKMFSLLGFCVDGVVISGVAQAGG